MLLTVISLLLNHRNLIVVPINRSLVIPFAASVPQEKKSMIGTGFDIPFIKL
jgi:hypothetical protein